MARGLLGFRAVKVTLEEFSRVLAALHEAAADPQGWEAPIAGAMRLLGASKGAILDVDASGLADAAYILDGHARIRHLNRAGGRLALAEPRGQAAFEAAVRAAAGKAARCTLLPLPRADGEPAAEVVISPLHAQHALAADWQLPLALVVIGLARHDARSIAARMRALYGLTPAEARVVALLAMGATVRDIAHANQVREVTVRSQLRSIAHKTGAGRQADLVRLALGGAGISLE